MRLLPTPPASYTGGQILFNGEDLLRAGERRLHGDQMAMIFQEPMVSLNPMRSSKKRASSPLWRKWG